MGAISLQQSMNNDGEPVFTLLLIYVSPFSCVNRFDILLWQAALHLFQTILQTVSPGQYYQLRLQIKLRIFVRV